MYPGMSSKPATTGGDQTYPGNSNYGSRYNTNSRSPQFVSNEVYTLLQSPSLIGKYSIVNHHRLANDISTLLSQPQYSNLNLLTSNYTSSSGITHIWLRIHGTVPIMYAGNSYNIPIGIFVPDQYPKQAPLMYVEPTANMHITKDHANVDKDGRVYVDEIASWSPASSNLVLLVNKCVEIFGQSPPVRANRASDPAPQITPKPNYSSSSYPGSQANNSYSNGFGNYPSNGIASNSTSQDQYHSLSQNTNVNSNTFSNAANYSPTARDLQLMLKLKLQNRMKRHTTEMREKLDSAIEDQFLLTQSERKASVAKDNLSKIEQQLQEQLQLITAQKEKIQAELEANRAISEKSKAVFDESQSKIDILLPKDTLTKQMLQCYSKINALDDLFYLLDKGLQEQKVDQVTFLRLIRKYGKEQFLVKALAKKVLKKQQSHKQSPYP